MGASCSSRSPSEAATSTPGMYKLEIELKRGYNLAIRDRGGAGSSDPYVKFKLAGKEVFRSKIIHKNLNPVWDEKTTLIVDSLSEPLYVKVFDYDFGLQDDFMGSAFLYLESLEQQRTIPVTLVLKDPQLPNEDLGSLELAVTLTPKRSPMEEPRDAAAMSKTLNPQWREQFDLHVYEETGGVLEITVWDKDTGRRDDFIGRSQLDLSTLSKEKTHHLELPLEESRGVLVLLVTLTASAAVSIADLSLTPLDDPEERREIVKRYDVRKSLSNLRDVGLVQVKVLRAEGLMVADVTGKSDPFCVLELNNDRLQTHTIYKNLNPEWNKVFTFNVKDVHSVLEVSVFDEDRDRSADFLGKVAIPLLNIHNGVQRAYLLKNKELTAPTKGVIYLEMEVIYNTVTVTLQLIKAALKTVVPAEKKYVEEEPKVSKQLLQQNFNRVKRCIMVLFSYGTYINSCFEWESSQRSITAFIVRRTHTHTHTHTQDAVSPQCLLCPQLFVVVVWNFELYMLPLGLVLLLVWNYFFSSGRETAETSMEAMFEWEDDEEDKEEKDSEHKGFMDKLYAIQDVFISVQTALDEVASFGERLKNTFNWTVPFLSWLAITALCLATLLLYLIPLRYLVLAWGVNKFTKKLRNPYMIENNELLDFLSRVPSDVQMVGTAAMLAAARLMMNILALTLILNLTIHA
ncbi:hypothetical protein CCH79_00001279 [Gambusia affinis]|uniref:C2 domain-containing protein n=1 Tax=Gambusia affinis TaxID=33528 RepID=A0A315VVX0_GAMAF|nr:hypothetical protein CCH79_00001279 [Gambusia affinis]